MTIPELIAAQEDELATAIRRNDESTLNRLVNSDFTSLTAIAARELRVGLRDDWLRTAKEDSGDEPLATIDTAVSVHGLLAIAARLSAVNSTIAGPDKSMYTVDVWQQIDGSWQLIQRHSRVD